MAHRVLSTLLLALVAMAVIILVVPLIRKYSGTNEQIIFVAILVVLLVELVSTKLRTFVDWLLYGQRRDAAAVSSRLARELELASEDAAAPALVAALADTLRLSYVAAFVDGGSEHEPIAAVGMPSGTEKRFPVRHSGEELGELRAGRRAQGLKPSGGAHARRGGGPTGGGAPCGLARRRSEAHPRAPRVLA
ncbi:MAG: hypothetical protein ABR571_09085 [Jatrophihabitans sp.]|uniref:hypothetical protein n=1 Tax=Jatrophihabitans sp. TaxID=1932789 RepID=UPI00390EC65D